MAAAGLSVLMRYTLRLLTLDQLGRAATLICALELERQADPAKLGDWPFEIGLWVGRAATPNHMGARATKTRTRAERDDRILNDDRSRRRSRSRSARGAEKSSQPSFELNRIRTSPTDLRITARTAVAISAAAAAADPGGGRADLPPAALLHDRDRGQVRRDAVDRTGGRPSSARSDRHDAHGFYGPCDPRVARLVPGPYCRPT